jgi:RND family efflux transporter MFP subunit
VEAAANRVNEARSQLAYSDITAPFGGYVTSRSVDEGDLSSPGEPLITVEMQDSMKVVTSLSEKDVGKVNVGQTAWVETDVPGIGLIPARVQSVVPAGDPVTRRFKVQLVVPNSNGHLVSGLFARVLFQTGEVEAVSVPEEAVVRRGQLTGLFVVDDEGLTRLRWVRLGRHSGDRIEVLSGLTAGERIVAGQLRQMREGVRIEEARL